MDVCMCVCVPKTADTFILIYLNTFTTQIVIATTTTVIIIIILIKNFNKRIRQDMREERDREVGRGVVCCLEMLEEGKNNERSLQI